MGEQEKKRLAFVLYSALIYIIAELGHTSVLGGCSDEGRIGLGETHRLAGAVPGLQLLALGAHEREIR